MKPYETIQQWKGFVGRHRAWCWLIFLLFYVAFFFNAIIHSDQTFIDLAKSFLQGKLYFIDDVVYDTASFLGLRYWPLGPFPAVLITPFVWLFSLIGAPFYQGYLNGILGIAVFFIWIRIARRLGYDERSSLIWASAFVFASPFIAAFFLPAYAHFAHTITVFFLSLVLYEYSTKKRPLALGLCMAAVSATRISAGFCSLFFLCDILFLSHDVLRTKVKRLILFLCPLAAAGLLLGWYNFARFGSPFEFGYSLQALYYPELIRLREQGLMSIMHVLPNLYYLLLALPVIVTSGATLTFPFFKPDPWGMSIFITSPYFFQLFFFRYRSALSRYLFLTILVVLTPLLLYYGIGFRQFGYRYALDFLPLLFYLLLVEYKMKRQNISRTMEWVVGISIIIDVYLVLTFLIL